MPAGQAVRAILKALLEKLHANEAGVRAQLDPEFLHDFRVALRQTRSALALLNQALLTEPLAFFRTEFKWLSRHTGVVRDLDVFLASLPDYRAALGGGDELTLAPLEAHLRHKRLQASASLIAALDSSRYRELLRAWAEFLDSAAEESPAGGQPVAEFAASRIRWACRRSRRRARRINAKSPARVLHRLRIDCKKLRYLLEFFVSLYRADAADRIIRPLKRLQDNLGTFNDLHVQQQAMLNFGVAFEAEVPEDYRPVAARLNALLHRRARAQRRCLKRLLAQFRKASRRARVGTLLGGHS